MISEHLAGGDCLNVGTLRFGHQLFEVRRNERFKRMSH